METTSDKGVKQTAIAVILPTKGVEIVGFDVFPLNVTCCTRAFPQTASVHRDVECASSRLTLLVLEAIPQSSTIGTFWEPQAPYKNTTCAGMRSLLKAS